MAPLGNPQPPSDKLNLEAAIDDYFSSKSKAGILSKTSSNTLTGVQLPDPVELPQYFSKLSKSINLQGISQRLRAENFAKWSYYLATGYNILVYGVGSKIDLLNNFRKEILHGSHCVEVPAYRHDVTLRDVIQVVCDEFLISQKVPRSSLEQIKALVDFFSKASSPVVHFIVHNIDGPNFQSEQIHNHLAKLAQCPRVRFIASIDNVYAPLLKTITDIDSFSWLFQTVHTLKTYHLHECRFEESEVLQSILTGSCHLDLQIDELAAGMSGTLISLKQVMASLTQNSREIFKIIAEFQYNAQEEADQVPLMNTDRGKSKPAAPASPEECEMSIETLYWKCRDSFLASNETTFRAQLTEYKDHKLIKIRRTCDGSELVSATLTKSDLKDFLDKFEQFCL